MTRLTEKLTVLAGTDDLKGELGVNLTEQGNRAATTLVKTVAITALSKTSLPSAAPVIDWHGQICGDEGSGARAGAPDSHRLASAVAAGRGGRRWARRN